MMSVMGDMMREILHDYHAYVQDWGYYGPAYVKPMTYSTAQFPGFILTPFSKRLGKQYDVRRSHDDTYWQFMEIPF